MSRVDALETEIQAKASVAPRVRPQDIQDAIVAEHGFTIGAALRALGHPTAPEFDLMTMVVLKLENGFTVHGVSAVASPENFNAEIGYKVARENAERAIWPLLGYALRDKLHAIATAIEPARDDRHPLHAGVVVDRSLD